MCHRCGILHIHVCGYVITIMFYYRPVGHYLECRKWSSSTLCIYSMYMFFSLYTEHASTLSFSSSLARCSLPLGSNIKGAPSIGSSPFFLLSPVFALGLPFPVAVVFLAFEGGLLASFLVVGFCSLEDGGALAIIAGLCLSRRTFTCCFEAGYTNNDKHKQTKLMLSQKKISN